MDIKIGFKAMERMMMDNDSWVEYLFDLDDKDKVEEFGKKFYYSFIENLPEDFKTKVKKLFFVYDHDENCSYYSNYIGIKNNENCTGYEKHKSLGNYHYTIHEDCEEFSYACESCIEIYEIVVNAMYETMMDMWEYITIHNDDEEELEA